MKQCDLIMKGGTTSGVVYPKAIEQLGKAYRLRSIAGTSAGAIAATVAAAAEYRRQTSPNRDDTSGFDEVGKLSEELGSDLVRFLQPCKDLKPMFNALMAAQRKRAEIAKKHEDWDHEKDLSLPEKAQIFWEVLRHLGTIGLQSAGLGVAAGFGGTAAGLVSSGFGGVLGIGTAAGFGIFRILQVTSNALKKNNYGIVPGVTQTHIDGNDQALSDWLADQIDRIAGYDGGASGSDPLTVGHLRRAGLDAQETAGEVGLLPVIQIAAMTTDLTSKRPYTLPFARQDHYYFDPTELAKVVPQRVVDYMTRVSTAGHIAREIGSDDDPKTQDLYPVPVGDAFPIVLIARMSLSFPVLLQTVPLYRRDVGGRDETQWIKCYFSDGGIASNLPVHFFDRWLPTRPTFAIALDTFDKTRHENADRVTFEQGKRDVLEMPSIDISSTIKFLTSIVFTATDWQDRLQSQLPGMHERVVTVRLKKTEGGTNITMDDEVIERLEGFGQDAGALLVNDGEGSFDFDENRWRRGLSMLTELEDLLPGLHNAIVNKWPQETGKTYLELAREHVSDAYPLDPAGRAAMTALLEALSALAQGTMDTPEGERLAAGHVPETNGDLRLVASADFGATQTTQGGVQSGGEAQRAGF